jgi:methylated-DNA-protein-cysteine methyltransferase-like protein
MSGCGSVYRDSEFARFEDVVREILRRVPEAVVVTYGQVAALAGRPRAARQVGHILSALPETTDVPWHRVINASGEVSPRGSEDGIREGFQRHLLEEEGIEFGPSGRIDLARYRWEPELSVKGAGESSGR